MAIEIPIKLSGLKALKEDIEKLEVNLAKSFDSKEASELEYKIGLAKLRVEELNKEIEKSDYGFKKAFGGAVDNLDQAKEAILGLDFKSAQSQVDAFSKNAKKITFKDAVGSLKNLGKTFVTLGKTLLTNPLFLIAAAVAGIVYAIFNLLKKLGVLDKAFKAVGDAIKKVWEWIKKAIEIMAYFNPAAAIANWLIKLYEKNEVEKKALELQRKVADEKIKQLKKEEEATGNKFDFEIRKINASGKETFKAEQEKRAAILQTLAAQNDALRVLVQSGKATEDQIKVWNENQKKIRQLKQDAVVAEIEQEQKLLKATKEAEDKKNEARKKALEDAKKYAEQRIQAQRQIQDIELALLDDGVNKEIQANNIKYQRLIEDTNKNENLVATERKRLTDLYLKEQEQTNQKIIDNEQKRLDEIAKQDEETAKQKLIDERAKADAISQIYLDIRKEGLKENDFAGLIALTEDQYALELSMLEFQLEQGQITKEQYAAREEQLEKEKQNEITKIQEDANKKRLEDRKAAEEGAFDITKNSLNSITENINVTNEKIKAAFEEEKKALDEKLKSGLISQEEYNSLSENITEKHAAKGAKISKGIAVAQATIDTYQGAQKAYVRALDVPLIGNVLAPIAAASAIALGVANVRKILAVNPTSGGGSPSSAAPRASSASSASTQSVPSFNLFGGGNNLNEQTAGQNRDSSPQVIQAVVSETEVTATQERITKIRQLNEL
jgi:hypothetical protein